MTTNIVYHGVTVEFDHEGKQASYKLTPHGPAPIYRAERDGEEICDGWSLDKTVAKCAFHFGQEVGK